MVPVIRQCLLQTAQGHKEDREASHPCGPTLIGPPHHRSVDPQPMEPINGLGIIESAKINTVDRL